MHKNQTALRSLIIIIISTLMIQLSGHYFAPSTLVIGESFYALWFILRIGIPAALVGALAIPLSQLYLGLPRWEKSSLRVFMLGLGMLIIIFLYLHFFGDSYLNQYSSQALRTDPMHGFQQFLIFTSSTMTGWEILHRCFLLAGCIYFLTQLKLDKSSAVIIAMVITCVFESLFHIKKPMVESFGMILASPFFCWLTVRTQSVWPAMLLHFLIEVVFAYNLFFH